MPRTSPARDRLLATAAQIFYREGIHAVGVDRLVTEAGVTRATFYKHFPSKDDLVRAYVELEDAALRRLFADGAAQADDPSELLGVVIDGVALDVEHHHTRGCPFINAAAEFPDPEHPVRVAVRAHRDWFEATLVGAAEAAGVDDPAGVGRSLVLLRDAALVGSYLDGPAVAVPSFRSTARRLAGLGS